MPISQANSIVCCTLPSDASPKKSNKATRESHHQQQQQLQTVQTQLLFCPPAEDTTGLDAMVKAAFNQPTSGACSPTASTTVIPTPAAVATKYDQTTGQIDNSVKNGKRRKTTKQAVGELNWKRNQRKILRNSGKAYTNTSGKLVNEKKFIEYDCRCPLKCAENIPIAKRKAVFDSFWNLGDWAKQTSFIHSNIEVIQKKRAYKKTESRRKYTRIFKLCDIRICKKMFTQTLSISDSRLHRAIAHKRPGVHRLPKSDLRGRHQPHNKLPENIIESIREHIRELPRNMVREVRQQLQAATKKVPNTSEMTVTRLYANYKAFCEQRGVTPAKQWMYRHTFHMVVDPRHINKCTRCQVEQKRKLREQEKQCAQLPEFAGLIQNTTTVSNKSEEESAQPLDLTHANPDDLITQNIPLLDQQQAYSIPGTIPSTIPEPVQPFAQIQPSDVSNATTGMIPVDLLTENGNGGETNVNSKNKKESKDDKEKMEFLRTIFQDKKNKRKLLRNIGASYVNSAGRLIAGKQFNENFNCNCPLHCSNKLDNEDRRRIFEEYWQLGDWDKQTAFLHESIEVTNIKRKQKKPDSRRKHTRVFRLCGVKVCKMMFINTLGITSARVNRAVDHKIPGVEAEPKKDQRGQHAPHNKTDPAVIHHIRRHIQCIGASSGMDTSRMYQLYYADCEKMNVKAAKLWMYRQILNTEFRVERQAYLDAQKEGKRKKNEEESMRSQVITSLPSQSTNNYAQQHVVSTNEQQQFASNAIQQPSLQSIDGVQVVVDNRMPQEVIIPQQRQFEQQPAIVDTNGQQLNYFLLCAAPIDGQQQVQHQTNEILQTVVPLHH